MWGEADGEVLFHPDEAVITAIRSIFARFAETGSARRVWLWLRDQGHKLPLQMSAHAEIRWVEASYHAIHQVLTNPVYAGAYVYGKTRTEMTLDASGVRRKRIRLLLLTRPSRSGPAEPNRCGPAPDHCRRRA